MTSVAVATANTRLGVISLREDTKRNKLAALLGMDSPPARTSAKPKVARDDVSREAEALINFVEAPQTFARITCRVCKGDFLVNRANVACCSDTCRARELDALGIKWDWDKAPESRWYVSSQQNLKATNEPLVVMPAALRALQTALLLWGDEVAKVPTLDVVDDLET
jgi:hypothetical protein